MGLSDARAASVADPAESNAGERNRWARRYFEGYLAETMRNDLASARSAFREVIDGSAEVDPELAARAALRLADLERVAGSRRKALELVARAAVLGRDDVGIVERADRMQAHLSSLRSKGSEVRGPPPGTVLEETSAEANGLFAKAESQLEAYHRVRLEPRLEGLRSGMRRKEHAMGTAVKAYRGVVALGEPGAILAAEFRIASLHHDMALSLMFDVPPELEAREAAKLRRDLRGRAIAQLKKARVAYSRSIDAGPIGGGSHLTRWRVASSAGLRAVEDLLRGRD